jgi:hypothetical protein
MAGRPPQIRLPIIRQIKRRPTQTQIPGEPRFAQVSGGSVNTLAC